MMQARSKSPFGSLALMLCALGCEPGTGGSGAGAAALPWPDTSPSPAAQAATSRSGERARQLGPLDTENTGSLSLPGELLEESAVFDPFAGPPPQPPSSDPSEGELPPPPSPNDEGSAGSGSEQAPEAAPLGCRFNGNECAFYDGRSGYIVFTNDAETGVEVTLSLWDPATGSVALINGHAAWTEITVPTAYEYGDDWGVQLDNHDVETLDRVATWEEDHWLLSATDLRAAEPCKFNGNVCSLSEGLVGNLAIGNGLVTAVTIVLWHPDSGSPFESFGVASGQVLETALSIGDDWGVQLEGGSVRTLDRVASYGGGWFLDVDTLQQGFLIERTP